VHEFEAGDLDRRLEVATAERQWVVAVLQRTRGRGEVAAADHRDLVALDGGQGLDDVDRLGHVAVAPGRDLASPGDVPHTLVVLDTVDGEVDVPFDADGSVDFE
jgi:hypothetical protein